MISLNWKKRLLVLMIVAVPAFTGYPVSSWSGAILPGLSRGWTIYLLLVNVCVLLMTGPRTYANILSVATLVSLPVVFAGAAISFLLALVRIGPTAGLYAHSAHYVTLCITMLTVVPLALGMVVILPFQHFEQNLLRSRNGVSRIEKFLLMFLRVFNHIVFFVIPNILEVLREEGQYTGGNGTSVPAGLPSRKPALGKRFWGLVQLMTQVGVEGICGAIQYIPIWTIEIAQLPGRTTGNRQQETGNRK